VLPEVTVLPAGPRERDRAADLAEKAPKLVVRTARTLGLPVPSRMEVVVAGAVPRTTAERRALGVGRVPPWAAGIAQPAHGRIVLFTARMAEYPHDDLPGVFAHEVAHLLVGAQLPRGVHLPRWYSEGLAMLAERAVSLEDALQLARLAWVHEPLPLERLDRDWPRAAPAARAAYAQSHSLVSLAHEQAAAGAPARLLDRLRAGEPFDRAFLHAYGQTPSRLEARWREQLRHRYLAVPVAVLTTAANGLMGVLAVVAWVALRRRRRRRLAEMELEERFLEPPRDW
jgi:hypothetical protein